MPFSLSANLPVDQVALPISTEYRPVSERLADGKALRQSLKRSAHGDYFPADNREDPIALLEAQAQTRLPDLVPIRYGRMLASPFAFFRGAAAIMIRDIAPAPTTGLTVQACGDVHVSNFGVFASAERNLIFGINDFDETYPGAWEWDLKRLVASFVVAGRSLGADSALCEEAVRAIVQSYRQNLRIYAEMGYLELWYETISEEELLQKLPDELRQKTGRLLTKARERSNLQTLDKITDLIDEQRRIGRCADSVCSCLCRPNRTRL